MTYADAVAAKKEWCILILKKICNLNGQVLTRISNNKIDVYKNFSITVYKKDLVFTGYLIQVCLEINNITFIGRYQGGTYYV